MNPHAEHEDFPPGTWVRTPTGRIGWIEKCRGSESKHDCFQRLVVRFSDAPRDTVVLQPYLLERLDKSPAREEQEGKMD